jgi:hypothetical protein
MNKINTRTYTKDPNMISRIVAGDMVLVPISQNVGDIVSIYTLNSVGARIWELLDGSTTIKQITNIISTEYGVALERAEADILEFLTDLEQFGAITTENGDNIVQLTDR